MDKVKKILLSIKNPEQILKIEAALQRCAELLVENFIESSVAENPYWDSFDLKIEWRHQLENVFRKSGYCNGEGFSVGDAFGDAVFKVSEFNDAAVVRIVYPVLFYTLVLKNYYKPNTANRRLQRGSKTWGNTRDMLDVPSVEKENNAVPMTLAVRKRLGQLREQLQELALETEQKCEQLLNEPVSGTGSSQIFHLQELKDLLLHAKTAMTLLDQEKIGRLEIIARRGLFARAILKSQQKNSRPVDSILRMYLLEKVDNLLFRTEWLSNGYRDPAVPVNYLLTSFFENEGIDVSLVLDADFDEKTYRKSAVTITNGDKLAGDFGEIYAQLSALKFEQEFVGELLDYYFQEERLEWFWHFRGHIENYAVTVISSLQKSQGIDNRYLDIENLSAAEKVLQLEDGLCEASVERVGISYLPINNI